ncbi:MAG: B12-binding domain-containing radical SAM protein [Spirochaetota bacterium]
MHVALVNTNLIRPPIAPIGLEYVGEALAAAGHTPHILDLTWESDPPSAVRDFFMKKEYHLVGLTLRNTDDCAFQSRFSFVEGFAQIAGTIRKHCGGVIVVGGAGFSVMPEQVLELCGADAGVWGDGEETFPAVAGIIENSCERDVPHQVLSLLPNLVCKKEGRWTRNPFRYTDLEKTPGFRRELFDNRLYFSLGGQGGFETKRGCNRTCIYCADPAAKGSIIRMRHPESVAEELENLAAQGIDHLHTCDSEFNLPREHAEQVCRQIDRRGLGEKIRWYAYCSPECFHQDLARKMKKAGCAGINFGADSGDPGMLRRLNRRFSPEDIVNSVRTASQAGIPVMVDLLLGAPGETHQSILNTIQLVKSSGADVAGIAVGVRVYPGTGLERYIWEHKLEHGLEASTPEAAPREPSFAPVFFMEPGVKSTIFDLLDRLVGTDERFLFFDPSKPESNYNYNANQRLEDAIKQGFRGAYWDILRKLRTTNTG